MDLHQRYPAIRDLRARAARRIPHFVWEYLDSATGTEATARRNRAALDRITLPPSILHGPLEPDLSAPLFGHVFPLPFGAAPVGMSGLVWPDAERLLARAVTGAGLPYSLSTVASRTPEDVAPCLAGAAPANATAADPGGAAQGWFQMYPPKDTGIRDDMLARARAAGFGVLVLTVDVPVASRRERQVRSGLTQPPKITPRLLAQVLRRPAWAAGMARMGLPRMRLIESYTAAAAARGALSSTAHIGYLLRTSPDWAYLKALRAAWQGPLIVKGVLRAEDAARLQDEGVDAIWVSNHAGRQFDAAPAVIEVLPQIRAATRLPVIADSGIEGGLDIIRAMALGADFVMLGRAWHYALAALGPQGPAHLVDILRQDLIANLGQLGIARLADLRALPGFGAGRDS